MKNMSGTHKRYTLNTLCKGESEKKPPQNVQLSYLFTKTKLQRYGFQQQGLGLVEACL